jgi:hypothetical protein
MNHRYKYCRPPRDPHRQSAGELESSAPGDDVELAAEQDSSPGRLQPICAEQQPVAI